MTNGGHPAKKQDTASKKKSGQTAKPKGESAQKPRERLDAQSGS